MANFRCLGYRNPCGYGNTQQRFLKKLSDTEEVALTVSRQLPIM